MNYTDYHSELNRRTDVEVPETSSDSLCQGRLSIKLGDRFRIDESKPSFADFHPEVVNNVGDGPQKSKGLQQKQQAHCKTDEVVRYMSNLPTYLERGENHKDKTFNVGVLEWRRLEKWQYKQQQVPNQSCRSSPSSSNTSSFSSTEGSSSYSSRGHSCSPARQRPHNTVAIDSNLNVSPGKAYSRATKTSDRTGLKSHDLVDIPSNYLKLQQSILKTHQSFNKYTEHKPKECKTNLDLHSNSDEKRLQQPENLFVASSSKGKSKVQDGEVLEEKENLQGLNSDHSGSLNIDRQQTVVILLPKDGQEVRYPACSKKSGSAGKYDREAIETRRLSFIDESNCKFNELYSGLSRSCPLSPEVNALSQQQNQTEQPSFTGPQGIKFPSEPNQSIPYSGRLSVSPVRSKNLQENMSIRKLNSLADIPKPKTDIGESNCKVSGLPSIIPVSCPLSYEADAIFHSQYQTEQPSSIRAKCVKFQAEVSRSTSYSGRSPASPVRGKNLDDRKSAKKLNSLAEFPKLRMDVAEDCKVAKCAKFQAEVSQSTLYFDRSPASPVRGKNLNDRKSAKKLNSLAEVPKLRMDVAEDCKVAKCVKFQAEVSQSTSYFGRSPASPVRGKNLDDRKSAKKLNSLAEVPKLRMDVEEDCKVRHPSPVRRFSFSMGKMGRNFSSKDSCMPQGIHPTSEISSGGAETSVLSVDSSCDKSNATSKGRSSPLRRLLDPLLKPKAGNSDISSDSKQRNSAQIDRGCKFSGGRGEASALHSVKVKLDLGSCKSIDIDHPRDLGKCGSTMVQALLQVAVKNGLPLFTFAVDNSSDILAATMKKLTSGRKDGNNLIYTFFAVHEMKKKNGNWLSQGSKDKNHDYISDIVGQMKVFDVPNAVLTGQNSVDQCSVREFVLLAASARQANQQQPDLQASDELAAIVVKLPKMTAKPLSDGGPKQCYTRKPSGNLKESPREVGGHFDCRDTEGSGSSSGSIDPLGLTVILPGGNHGVPSDGKPSPLIERWRLGGSCDCGGWDIGCRLRVFASEAQVNRSSGPNKSESIAGKFQLYSQEPVSDRKCIFSLSPFKDGIYSIEFDSSLKLLQAFSICIAVLNGLKPADSSELSHFFEKKSTEETILSAMDGERVPNRYMEDIPASFIACPPDSPVARA